MKRRMSGWILQLFLVCFTIFCIQTTKAKPEGKIDDVDDNGYLIRDDRELFEEIADDWDSNWGSLYDYDKREEVKKNIDEEKKRYVDVDYGKEKKMKHNVPKIQDNVVDDDDSYLTNDDRDFLKIADDWNSRRNSQYDHEKGNKEQRGLEEEKRYIDVDNPVGSRKRNIPENGDLFEGDMVMTEFLRAIVLGDASKRDAVRNKKYKWPGGRVPYDLDDELDEDVKTNFQRALYDFDTYTCVRFFQRTTEPDYIYIFPNESMCYSSVGRHGGKQYVSLGLGCSKKGIIIHELMHVLGFIHEQSRPDRDDYVEILRENIEKGLEHNFEKFPSGLVNDFNEPYDYDSVLHYNNHAFSKNGDDTIRAINNPDRRFGQRIGFSKNDLRQINKLYGCTEELRDESLMDDILYD